MNSIHKLLITAATASMLSALSANAQNLLVDNTFDTNASIASWTGISDGFDADYNVTNFFRFDFDRITTDPWIADNNFSFVSQDVSGFTGDQSYDSTVSLFYNTTITAGSYDIFAKFVFLDASDISLGEFEATHDNTITSTGAGFITLYDGNFVTPTNTAKISVLFFANEVEADQILQLDAFSFTASAVPEPSAYALLAGILGLGYVMTARRRKA